MPQTFDATTLDALRSAQEVGVFTSRRPDRAVIIWIVAVGDAVFVRSFRGPNGHWYLAAVADGRVTLDIGGRHVHGRVNTVADSNTIEAVSRAFLAKYATSPHAKEMVRADVLSTTLRIGPM